MEVDTRSPDLDSTQDGAVSLGAQHPDEGRQFFEDKSLDRANGEKITYQSTHRAFVADHLVGGWGGDVLTRDECRDVLTADSWQASEQH